MNQEKQELPMEMSEEEIRLSSRRRHRTAGLVLIVVSFVVLIGGAGLLFGPALLASDTQEAATVPSMPPMPVETAEVRIADSHHVLTAVGTLHSEESVMITAEITGRIDRIGFIEGEKSKHEQLLIQLDSAVQEAEYDRAVASRNLSKANYQRAQDLLKDHAVSVKERDEAYAQWQLDEANVRLAQVQVAKAGIRSPFSGTLGLRQVSIGDYVQPGQPLVNLEAVDRLKVEFKIPEKYSAEVKVGQQVALQSDAYPGRDFSGQVYAIDPQVEVQSRSLVVRGLLDNADRELFPGQFVRVHLNVSTKSAALFIPEQALIPQPKTQLVFKVVEGKVQLVPVETGSRSKGWVEITSGLEAGDVVVTGGHQKIGPGSPVQALPADPELFARI